MRRATHVGGRPGRRDRGSALVITMVVMLMLMLLVVSVSSTTLARAETTEHGRRRVRLLGAAEAGIGFKLAEVAAAKADPSSFTERTWDVDGIAVRAWAEDIGANGADEDGDGKVDDADEKDKLRVRAVATSTDSRGRTLERGVEAYLGAAEHPLLHKAIYVGNANGVANYKFTIGAVDGALRRPADPASKNVKPSSAASSTTKDEAATDAGFEESATSSADYVEGDVFINGDLEIRGATNVYGKVEATGTTNGTRPVEGDAKDGATHIAPPDLSKVDYARMADFVVEAKTPSDTAERHTTAVDWIHRGVWNTDKESTLFTKNPAGYTNPNFQAGSAKMSGGDGGKAWTLPMNEITGEGNQLVFVKGNLWLESSHGYEFRFPASEGGKKVTVVVEGNLYISDQLSYASYENDAVMFIVKGKNDDPSTTEREDESYVDGYTTDGKYDPAKVNRKWDPGEIILNDSDGDPNTYHGPKEGQGNIYYGDPVQTWGGITDGFMYAQNNAYVLTGNTPGQIYGARGFLSAGGVMDMGNKDINRAKDGTIMANGKASNFVNYRVKEDPRLKEDKISLKGMPAAAGGGFAGLNVASWREMSPAEWLPPPP